MLLNIFILLHLIYLSLLKYRGPPSLWQEVKDSCHTQDLRTLAIVKPFAQSTRELSPEPVGTMCSLTDQLPTEGCHEQRGDMAQIYMPE